MAQTPGLAGGLLLMPPGKDIMVRERFMAEESVINTEVAQHARNDASKSAFRFLIAPSTFISFGMFIALIGMSILCFDWKRDSMLTQSLKEGLNFDSMGRANLLVKAEKALSHGLYYSADRLFTHTSELLKEGLDNGSIEKSKYLFNLAGCKSGLSAVRLEAAKIDEARALDDEALSICKDNADGSSWVYAQALLSAADIDLAQGKLDESKKHFAEALAILNEKGTKEEIAAQERRYMLLGKRYAAK